MTFKLLGINGSPKRPTSKSNTNFLLDIVLESAREKGGVETNLIHLSDFNIELCNGCEVCTTKICPLDEKDDYPEIESMIKESQGLIIGAPSYWAGPPGILKNFMDRSRDNKMPKQLWEGKLFSALSVAGLRVGGQESLIYSLITFGLAHGMLIVGGIGHPWFTAPFPMGTMMFEDVQDNESKIRFRSVKKDAIAKQDAKMLGFRIAEMGKKIFS